MAASRAEILEFMRRYSIATEASVSPSQTPQAAAVGFIVTDGFEMFFDTVASTRKLANLRENGSIAFVVGGTSEGDERTVQYEGVADEPAGVELEALKARYLTRFPEGRDRQAWPGLTYVRARPRWLRFSDFSHEPPEIVELTFDGTLIVRPEQPADRAAIADVNDRAFGGGDESRIVAALRRSGHATLSFVAVRGTTVAGHILFSPVRIDIPGARVAALGLAPMSVLPEYQRQGIGAKLVERGLAECARLGCEVVVVLGHPHFYQRFGFQPARLLGLSSEYAEAGDAFMAIELASGVLSGRGGLARYLPEFAG